MTDEILDDAADEELPPVSEQTAETDEPEPEPEFGAETPEEPAEELEAETPEVPTEELEAETPDEPADVVPGDAPEAAAAETTADAVDQPFWRRWTAWARRPKSDEVAASDATPAAPEPATDSAAPAAAGEETVINAAGGPDAEPGFLDYSLWETTVNGPVTEQEATVGDTPAPVQPSENDPTLLLPPVEAPYPAEAAPTEVLPMIAPVSPETPQLITPISVPGADDSVPLGAPSEIDMGPERRANLWVWVGLAAGVIIMAGAIGYAWWYTTSRSIPVPNVVGKLSAQATQVINDSDLRLGKVSQVPTDSAPVGTVIEQKPSAYSSLKPGESVAIVIAASPELAKVPDVSGRTAEEAIETVASQRLAARAIESYSATVAAGFVIAQVPTATTEAPPGSLVVLAVSKGVAPATQRVPHLAGLGEADANALLLPLGFRFVTVRSYSASVAAGVVVSQTPAPEMQVARDTVVLYSVSAGIGLTTGAVPSITGQTSTAAEARLKQLGLKAQIAEMSSTTVPKGTVIAQMPLAAARIETGGTVIMLVSSGAATNTVVPQLVAQASAEASKTAFSAGYEPIFVEVKSSAQAPGTVFAQWPPAGVALPVPASIIALVAKLP